MLLNGISSGWNRRQRWKKTVIRGSLCVMFQCVKALLYYDHGSTVVDINIANDFGDTPLHMAARWGYGE